MTFCDICGHNIVTHIRVYYILIIAAGQLANKYYESE